MENNKIIFGGKEQNHLWWKTAKSSLVENNKIIFGGKQQNHLWWKTTKSSLVENNKIIFGGEQQNQSMHPKTQIVFIWETDQVFSILKCFSNNTKAHVEFT